MLLVLQRAKIHLKLVNSLCCTVIDSAFAFASALILLLSFYKIVCLSLLAHISGCDYYMESVD